MRNLQKLELRSEPGAFRAARIQAAVHWLSIPLVQVRHAQQLPTPARAGRPFDKEVLRLAANPQPHFVATAREVLQRPVGAAVVRDHGAELRRSLRFVFHRGLDPT